MLRSLMPAAGLVAASMLTLMPFGPAQAARFFDPGLHAPTLTEPVACRVIRERIVRPNGSVVFETRRTCEPGLVFARGPGCRFIRERIVRPSGAVVYRSIRRCD
ncbi:MAG: hypothetical protein QOF91_493 [Alphaproteobacteria bacterium]|jgi:hypothetical protein|nr:hypothetical protein [Alphaproteobacteria bacterium]